MKLLYEVSQLLFPPKCVLCGALLQPQQTDLCPDCRKDTPDFPRVTKKVPYLAHWGALWYYEGTVRRSLLRFKFRGSRSYAQVYGRLLAMKILQEAEDFDLLTWVPISPLRRWRRGYDQVELIAKAAAGELNVPATPTLKKLRNNQPQSRLKNAAARRANVLGVYRILAPAAVSGKRIVLLDDIMTTGATASECARVLLSAGAKEVSCFAVAASHQQKNNR